MFQEIVGGEKRCRAVANQPVGAPGGRRSDRAGNGEHVPALLECGGNRDHRPLGDTLVQLETLLREAWRRGGNVIIPAFAVGRTQELLFYIGQLAHEGKLDAWQVILDSPMAIAVTHIYDRWLRDLGIPQPYLLFVGNPAKPHKNLDTVVQAYARAIGPALDALRAAHRELGLEGVQA